MTDTWDEKPDRNNPKYTVVLRDNDSVFRDEWFNRDMDAWLEKVEIEYNKKSTLLIAAENCIHSLNDEVVEMRDKLESVKPLILELFGHADHGLDSHNPRSFEIRKLRDKIIRSIGETQA